MPARAPSRSSRSLLLAALGLALTLAPATAGANGRFPAAGQIAPSPTDGAKLVVRTTFGLLVSSDAGAHFDWVCEQAVKLSADQDPQVALFGDGTVAVAPFEGLSLSRDGGCSFDFAEAQGAGESVLDLSVCRSSPSTAVAVSWSSKTKESAVYGSSDGGKSWGALGKLPGTDVVPQTIDVAPGSADVVLVSGTFSQGGKLSGAVFRSGDGGKSFARADVALEGESGLYLAAVDPQDPTLVYARTSGGKADRLLASHDGGASFAEIGRTKGPMLGFALSPDGSTLAIGGPDDGVLVADAASPSFAQAWPKPVSCLAWSAAGLYACGPSGSPFAVGLSTDKASSFQALLPSLASIRGPLSCPAGTPQASLCAPAWPDQQKALSGSGGSAGSAGASGGASGGAGAAGALPAGSSGSGGAGAAGAPSSGAAGSGPVSFEGDSCATAPGRSSGLWAGLLALAALALALGRQTKTSPPAPPHRRGEGSITNGN